MEQRVASLGEVRSALNAEHEHMWGLLADVRNARESDRGAVLARLLRYLAVHQSAEEVVVHNAWVGDATRDRLDEEREIAQVLERLVDTAESGATESNPTERNPTEPNLSDLRQPGTQADGDFRSTLDTLERLLRDHAEAEENEELPVLASELSPESMGEMLRVLLMVREMGEDSATPIAEDSYAAMRLAAQREFRAAVAQLR